MARAARHLSQGKQRGLVPRFPDTSPDLIHREMEKIIASRTFRTASAQRNFLRYVVTEAVQGRSELLKEYSIGVAVFQKREAFDPRLDSIVRTEAHKLRARLAKYYEIEGREDVLRIEIPVGKYAPVFKPAAKDAECVAEEVRPTEVTPVTVPALRAQNTIDRFEDPGLLFSAGFYPVESFPERFSNHRREVAMGVR